MFAADGTMLQCSMKSKLVTILEKLPLDEAATLDQTDENAADTSIFFHQAQGQLQNLTDQLQTLKSHLVDAMAIVQSMGKPEWITVAN